MRSHAFPRFVALLLAAVAMSTGVGAPARAAAVPGQIQIHTRVVELGPTEEPRVFTVDCGPQEQLVSGGYAGFNALLKVTGSYPSDGRGAAAQPGGVPPGSWSVGVVNESKTVVNLQIAAACLVGAQVQGSVAVERKVDTGSGYAVSVDCPDGTVRVAGGYDTKWSPANGTPRVVGSYPQAERRWTLDVATLPAGPDFDRQTATTAYAMCLAGKVGVAAFAPVAFALNESRAQTARCEPEQVLVGGGYQATDGTLIATDAVLVDTPTANLAWVTDIRGSANAASRDAKLQLTPLCLIDAALAQPTQEPGTTGVSLTWPVAGAGALVLLLLIVLSALTLRRLSKRDSSRRQPPAPQLDVVVRAQRAVYRVADFREQS